MASRKEEKEARRAERLAQEAADASQAAKKKRFLVIGGGILVIAVVVAVVLVVMGGSNKSDAKAKILTTAKAAGCQFNQFKSAGRQHATKAPKYKTNPPTSGTHYPEPADDGIYPPNSSPPAPNKFVHSLEHGRIIIQYKPGLPAADYRQLETAYNKREGGYHTILVENETKMPYEVAVTAWTRSLTCKKFKAKVIPAIQAFRDAYTDKGPEVVM